MKSIDDNARCCEAGGCFETAYGTRLCDQCLSDQAPASRGRTTWREALYARAYGGQDLAVIEQRLLASAPESVGLSAAEEVEEVGEDEVATDARDCPVCGNDCSDDDSLCWRCRSNVHSR